MVTLGTTLFSFSNEWCSGRWSIPEVLDRVAAHDLGPAIEVVGFQSFRDFPGLRTETIRAFRDSLDRHGLEPVMLGVDVDYARDRAELMSTETAHQYLVAQLDAATALGFPAVRTNLGLSVDLLERLVPDLERRDLLLTLEIQGPATLADPAVIEPLRLCERAQTAALGFTLDFSVAMVDLPPSLVRVLHTLGLDGDTEELLRAEWSRSGPVLPRFTTFAEAARARGASQELLDLCRSCFVRFGLSRPQDWCEVLPWVRHAHAKFWDLERAGELVGEPHDALLTELVRHGYRDAVLSEWGGSEWLSPADADAFTLTRRHLDLFSRALPTLGTNQP